MTPTAAHDTAAEEPDFTRDRWKRPLVIPPDGGRPIAYTRCTTYVDAVEDKFNLQQWQQRMVAIGLAARPALLAAAAAAGEDRDELNEVCRKAREAAEAGDKATLGTSLHRLTERADRGEQLRRLPETLDADVAAYLAATAPLTHTRIETRLVLDELQVAGTADRVVEVNGRRYIADIKTGRVDYGVVKIAAQLACYAHSVTFDTATGDRSPLDVDLTRGLVIHLPAGQGTCELVWVDLVAGWRAVQVAGDVRALRRLKFADLTEPLILAAPQPGDGILEEIAAATTPQEVRTVWQVHEPEWSDALTEVARARVAEVEAAVDSGVAS